MKESLDIILVGTGNIAHHLGLALQDAGHEIVQLVGRNKADTKALAKKLVVDFTLDLGHMRNDADLVILAVSDTGLADVPGKINPGNALVVHTSGSISVYVLNVFPNYGVFYPLQTFSKGRLVDFSDIPIFIEANSVKNIRLLKTLALQLSPKVEVCDSIHRKTLHLAAVFACNFSNHMYSIAEKIVEEKGLDFNSLAPLIIETAFKALDKQPKKAQTGPAIRNDKNTMDEHLALLSKQPEFQKIYSFVSKSILDFKEREKCDGPSSIQGD